MDDRGLDPHECFATQENVTRAHEGLKSLVESLGKHGLESIAIQEAARLFDRWSDEFVVQDIDPDFEYDDDRPLCWTHQHLDRGIGDSLRLAMGEMGAASRLLDLTGTPTKSAGTHKALQDRLTKLYGHIRDVILWDFGQNVNQLLDSSETSALPAHPYCPKGILWKLPNHVDKKESTGVPSTERFKKSSNESPDESSTEPSKKASKANAEVDDQPNYAGPKFHAAAEALKHLSEQDFEDMSRSYYVHPYIKKLLGLKYWETRSRKGKARAGPYTTWTTKQPFVAMDGVTEFMDPTKLPELPPPPKPMDPRLVEFFGRIDELATRHDFRTALERKAHLKNAQRHHTKTFRKSRDKQQAAEVLRWLHRLKIDYCLQVHLSALDGQHQSTESRTPSDAATKPSKQPMSARFLDRARHSKLSNCRNLKGSHSPHVPSPLRAVLRDECLKPAEPAAAAERTTVPGSHRPSAKTLPAKTSVTVSTESNGATKIPISSPVPLHPSSRAIVDLSTPAGESNDTSGVSKRSGMPLGTETQVMAESSRAAQLEPPTETTRLLEIGWKCSGLKTVNEVLEFAKLIPSRRPHQETEFSGSHEPAEPAKLFPSLYVAPTNGPSTKRPRSSSVQEPTDVKRRRKDGDAPLSPEDQNSQASSDEREGEGLEEGIASAAMALISLKHGSHTYNIAGSTSPTGPNAPIQTRKRSASRPLGPTEVKRCRQFGGSAESPMVITLVNEGAVRRRHNDPTDKRTLPDDNKVKRSSSWPVNPGPVFELMGERKDEEKAM